MKCTVLSALSLCAALAASAQESIVKGLPLPDHPVKPTDPDKLPLLPTDIELIPLMPDLPATMPRRKMKAASDAMQPVLPSLDFGPVAKVLVKKFTFRGNHVYSDALLAKLVEPYTGREISADELEAARMAISQLYAEDGYVNSGATLPDQDPADGVIEFEIVEGRLTEIELSGNRWYRSWWLKHALRRAGGTPLNFNKLRTGLQLMRQDGSLSRINAELKPGVKPGEGILHVTVKDEQPFRLGFELSNRRPPSVSEGTGDFIFSNGNLSGHGDVLDLRWSAMRWTMDGAVEFAEFENVQAGYEFPISPWGTTLRVSAGRGDSVIIEETFAALGITSVSEEISFTLRQPVIETLKDTVTVSLGADRRHSETFLLGRPFSLSPGAVDGESDVFAMRASVEWVNRSQVHVLAVRSTASWGLDAWGTTRAGGGAGGIVSNAASGGAAGDVPDGRFFTWLGQAQYVRRILDTPEMKKKPDKPLWNSLRESLLVVRANAQFSDQPLLALEQFALGGAQSVRGYRENQLLRDNGIFASIEWRVPVVQRADKTAVLTLAPFVDFGTGWNTVGDLGDDVNQTVFSAGLGVIWNPNKHVQASVYWGHPFKELNTTRESLQDYGWHVALSVNAF